MNRNTGEGEVTPDWVHDLIIDEIATTNFTSPAGPEIGTFLRAAERLDHLARLGINRIWLSGHSVADESHFCGIWTHYGVIEPDHPLVWSNHPHAPGQLS